MALAGLVHQRGGGGGDLDFAVGRTPLRIEDGNLRPADHHHIAFFQIGDAVGERRQRESVGADIGFRLGMADRQRRALARTHQEAFMILEDHGDGIGAGQPRHRLLGGIVGRKTLTQQIGDQMSGDFAVGFGFKTVASGHQLALQFAEILDDAVMHDGDARGGMGMGIAFGRRAMRRPARVTDAGMAAQRLLLQHRAQPVQIAGGAAARNLAVFQGGDARRVIAAIFQPLQRFQNDRCNIPRARDSDNATHAFFSPPSSFEGPFNCHSLS